jgi:hypothetical protein
VITVLENGLRLIKRLKDLLQMKINRVKKMKLSSIALALTLLLLAPSVDAAKTSISLSNPGSCMAQTGIATIQPSCLDNSQTFTIAGDCCSSTLNATLAIDATNFNALSGDCCNHCIGEGDQHAEDSTGKQITLGPCLARTTNSCLRQKSLCNPNICIWKGGSNQYSCEYVGVSPQIQLFTIDDANYGVNFTLGLRNSVQTITPLSNGVPLGTLDAANCNKFTSFNSRTGFSVSKSTGLKGVIVWTIADDISESKIVIDCEPYGELNYEVDIRGNNFSGLCKNSITSDPLVNSWIGDYKVCGGTPLPSTLNNPVKYNIQVTTTKWANLLSSLPKCTAGWVFNWLNGLISMQVAVPVGTFVPDAPNSQIQPGLYNGKLQIKYVPPGLGCGCAPNPGSTLKFQYGGNFKIEQC